MLDKVFEIVNLFTHNRIIQLVVAAVIFDTIFGVIRAVKERKFNSCFGIDGAIRKISMIVSLCGLLIVDYLVKVNLIGFVPEQIRTLIGVTTIGTSEFFGLLYIAYEIVSILKNMYLCGLPVKRVWATVQNFLSNYTDELPDTEEIEENNIGKLDTNHNKDL
jgi:toxin secretion/phage lysis holin